MALSEVVYIVTANEAFHDEAVEFTLTGARKLQKKLQKIEDIEVTDDAPTEQVEIYRLERVE